MTYDIHEIRCWLKLKLQNIQDCRSEKVIVQENTVFVNREKTMVRRPSLDENTELILPVLGESEGKVAVQSCTMYNTLVSTSTTSSGGSSPKSSSVQGFFIPPRFQVHSKPSNLPAFTSTDLTLPYIEGIEGSASLALQHVA